MTNVYSNVLVTGGAGFIGSHIVERLLLSGARVTVYDNASTGQPRFLVPLLNAYPALTIERGDLLDPHRLGEVMALGIDMVFHLAANADVRHGIEHPGYDFQQNVLATANVLEAMHNNNTSYIMFASTATVYGAPSLNPKSENAPFPIQTSFYAASKVAAESLISAYCAAFNMQSYICRFTPMIGPRYSHGHIFDFVKKLQTNPDQIEIIGDGKQRKYCLYIDDAVDGVFTAIDKLQERVNIVNIGNEQSYTIDDAVEWISEELGCKPRHCYTGSSWVGDDPHLQLDCTRMHALGWRPKTVLREAVKQTARYLLENPWLLDARD